MLAKLPPQPSSCWAIPMGMEISRLVRLARVARACASLSWAEAGRLQFVGRQCNTRVRYLCFFFALDISLASHCTSPCVLPGVHSTLALVLALLARVSSFRIAGTMVLFASHA